MGDLSAPSLLEALQAFERMAESIRVLEAVGVQRASGTGGVSSDLRHQARITTGASDEIADEQLEAEIGFWLISFADSLTSLRLVREAVDSAALVDAEQILRATISGTALLDAIRTRLGSIAA